MRYVSNKHLRRFADLGPLEKAANDIRKLPAKRRGPFINENQALCSALRSELWTLGCAKCWYSEASLQEPEGQVEHYRPKKRLSGASHGGYWWRAFDWKNLRLAHPTVNRRMREYITGKKAGKGSYFPLRHETKRAANVATEGGEEPVLLDPTNAADTTLLSFSETGRPVPRYREDEDEWRHRRASQSIEYYHLADGSWNAKRQDLMIAVQALCERIEVAAIPARRRRAYDEAVNQLLEYLDPFAEFSAACWQVVRDRGLLEVIYPGEVK